MAPEFDVVVTWARGRPSGAELGAVRKLWPPLAELPLAELRARLATSPTLTLTRVRYGEPARALVDAGRALGLDIVAVPATD